MRGSPTLRAAIESLPGRTRKPWFVQPEEILFLCSAARSFTSSTFQRFRLELLTATGTFRPVLHLLSAWTLKHRFNVRQITVRGEASLARLVEEFMGQSQKGTLVERIQKLQRFLVEQAEQKHGLGHCVTTASPPGSRRSAGSSGRN